MEKRPRLVSAIEAAVKSVEKSLAEPTPLDESARIRCSACSNVFGRKSVDDCRCPCHDGVPSMPRKGDADFYAPSYFIAPFGEQVRKAGGKAFRNLEETV